MSGSYSPSPGVIYPTLSWLEDMGFTAVENEDAGRKRYRLTAEGEAFLTANRPAVDALFGRLGSSGSVAPDAVLAPVLRGMENLNWRCACASGKARSTRIRHRPSPPHSTRQPRRLSAADERTLGAPRKRQRPPCDASQSLELFAGSKLRMVNELMLIVSTISSLLAGVAALAGELRARRRHRVIANTHDAQTHTQTDAPRGALLERGQPRR